MTWEQEQLNSFKEQQDQLQNDGQMELDLLHLIEEDEEGMEWAPGLQQDVAALLVAKAPEILITYLKHYTLG